MEDRKMQDTVQRKERDLIQISMVSTSPEAEGQVDATFSQVVAVAAFQPRALAGAEGD